jgi:hypothetical protein
MYLISELAGECGVNKDERKCLLPEPIRGKAGYIGIPPTFWI